MLRHDLGLKILSLFVALALWLYVIYPSAAGSGEPRVFNIVYINLDTEKYIIDTDPHRYSRSIKVNVSGPLDALSNLHALSDNQFNAEVNLANAQPGTNLYPV